MVIFRCSEEHKWNSSRNVRGRYMKTWTDTICTSDWYIVVPGILSGSTHFYVTSITSSLQIVPAPAGLTEFSGDDWNIMPGRLLSIQAFEQEHRSIPWMDVEQAVHVSATVDRVPVTRQTARRWERVKLSQWVGWTMVTLESVQPHQGVHNREDNWFLSICDGWRRAHSDRAVELL